MAPKTPKIDVLLASYEGEKFLAEQIDSILAQSYPHFRIIIRDDASQDNTTDIVHHYAKQYPEKILFIEGKERVGLKANFSKLMEHSSAPYIMFSDQDDVWTPKKIELSLARMSLMEKTYGENNPLLIHTDLTVVDENLKVLSPSFWKYANLKPQNEEPMSRLLNQNVVTGCTMMANRLLVELAMPIPEEAFMHDWWLALTASALGKIGLIEQSTIYYRQHGKNSLGAKKFGSLRNLFNGFDKLRKQDVRKFHQAHVFYHRYNEIFEASPKNIIKAFLNLQRSSWGQKRYAIFKHGFFKQGFMRNFADFIFG